METEKRKDRRLNTVLPWSKQVCPLCGEEKILIANGITLSEEDKMEFFPDRGYSFCNCKSIWFTDWANIDTRARHKNDSADVLKYYILRGDIVNLGYKKNKFLCPVEDTVVEEAVRLGWDVHDKLTEDNYIIWSYHELEHKCNPIVQLGMYYANLKEGGTLFIAMPDPYFIDFANAYGWRHWLMREHHIMWDMDTFCDELETIGFKIKFKTRNTRIKPNKDYHIICQK